jgi:hypothetical protein
MKRILPAGIAVALLVGAMAFSGGTKLAVAPDVQISVESQNPWTNLRFNNDPETFHFAVVSDRTGGHRARIFSQAVDQLNLLQPAFVVSVGDLIEGYTKDTTKLATQWKELQTYTSKLQMPFFYVPGNHDVSNAVEVEEWKQRFGRRYYHFLYKDVLFLAVATDDEGEDKVYGAISQQQVDYFTDVLKANPKVRWTVVMIHKPVWALEKAKADGWIAIEKALAGRQYTVFAGHVHRFEKFVRNGMNYYQLATTGGGSKMRGMEYREFDHITWVTMKSSGPTIAHVLLDGILPEDLKRTPTTEEAIVVYNRKQPQPARGKVLFNGAPPAGAKITFNQIDDKKKVAPVADALIEADGSFVLSSYTAWDGVPAGEYKVTIVLRDPSIDGRPTGQNRLPGKYASAFTTDLIANVRVGDNDFNFNLSP